MAFSDTYRKLAGLPPSAPEGESERLAMEKKTFELLRQKPASQLTPGQRAFLVSRAKLPLFQNLLTSETDTTPVGAELERSAVFESDVPRKAGENMGEILRLRGLFNERVSPEALKAAGIEDKRLVGLPLEALYTGGYAIEPAKASKVAVIQWGLIGNNAEKLFTELPALKHLVNARGNDPVRQRLRDSIDQSVKFYNRGISSNLRSPYTKTLFNHVIEGNAPEDVSLVRNSGVATTDVPVLREVNPYLRTLSEAARESFTRPDEFWANKPTPYAAPENPRQALAETLIGSIPSMVLPDLSGTPSDLLQNTTILPAGLADAAKLTSNLMPNPLVTGLKAAKATEPVLASVGAASSVDEFFKAISSANKGKAISKAMVEEALAAGNIPEFLQPFVSKTPAGKVVLEISPEAASALKIDPAQSKLLNEVNYAEKVKGDWQSSEWARKKLAGESQTSDASLAEANAWAEQQMAKEAQTLRTPPAQIQARREQLVQERLAQKAAQDAEAAAITGEELARNKAKGTLEEIRSQQTGAKLTARQSADEAAARLRGQETSKQMQDEMMARQAEEIERTGPVDNPFLPRPTFEPGPEVMTTVRGEPVRMTKEEVLGALQNGRASELPEEVFELASKGAKGKKKVPLAEVPLDVPVVNEVSTKQIAQQALLGNKLTKEQELYMQMNMDEVLAAMQQERSAAKVMGEAPQPAGAPPPVVQQAAKEVEQAQATAASASQNVDEAVEAAKIKSSLPPAVGVTDEAKKGLPWGKMAGLGTVLGAGTWYGKNALTSAMESVDKRNAPPAAPIPQETQKPLSPEESALMRRFGIIPFGESDAPSPAQAPQPVAPQPAQAQPFEEARMMVGSPDMMERAKRESVLVEPQGGGFDWKNLIGQVANAVAQGAEAYNTGVDPRRAWHELALQQQREAKIMPQMDAAAMQNFYAQQQAILDAQLKQQSYGFPNMRSMLDYKNKLAQDLYMNNMQGKSAQEQQAFRDRMQLVDQLNRQ